MNNKELTEKIVSELFKKYPNFLIHLAITEGDAGYSYSLSDARENFEAVVLEQLNLYNTQSCIQHLSIDFGKTGDPFSGEPGIAY